MTNDEEQSKDKERVDLFAVIPEDPTDEIAFRLPIEIDIAAATHPGLVRDNNEDHYLVIRFRRELENLSTNIPEDSLVRSFNITGYVILVADGMGGSAAGEVASSMALKKLVELLVDTPDWIMSLKRTREARTVLKRMTERFLQIDAALRTQAEQDSTLRGMGTTLTVAGMLGKDLVIGHVGDSRAYLLRKGSLGQITNDHTLAQRLIDAGLVKPGEPAARSMRHVLTAAVGSLGEHANPQVGIVTLSAGDQVLLCTDGLTDMLSDEVIASVLQKASSAQNACEKLVNLALSAGGLDNMTVVVARLNPPASEAMNI
jgi:PPM family protein phosphatase